MNRDEGQYQLTHIFDELLVQPSGSRSKSLRKQRTGNSTKDTMTTMDTNGSVSSSQRQSFI